MPPSTAYTSHGMRVPKASSRRPQTWTSTAACGSGAQCSRFDGVAAVGRRCSSRHLQARERPSQMWPIQPRLPNFGVEERWQALSTSLWWLLAFGCWCIWFRPEHRKQHSIFVERLLLAVSSSSWSWSRTGCAAGVRGLVVTAIRQRMGSQHEKDAALRRSAGSCVCTRKPACECVTYTLYIVELC